ncbi:MAG: outer membrane protein assembly factor BamB [Betaproteobacteria bacterium]|nr:outer membrane protein assembly factor BamB [Betaproteobacteria bacterium]
MTQRWVRLAASLVAACVLAACSSSGHEPAELKDIKPDVRGRVAWRVSVGDSGPYIFTPGIWNGDYFVTSAEGKLARIDGSNGKRKWRVDTDKPVSGGVGVQDGMVFVGTAKGEVLAYHAEDGKPVWHATVSSEVLSAPAVADGFVVVRSGDGHISGLDAQDGSRKWEYIPTSPPALTLRGAFGFTIDHGVVYVGLAGGKLIALRLTSGELLWETALSMPKGDTELERLTDVVNDPIVDNGQVCAVAFQGRIGCFDAARGTLVWARTASSSGGLAATRTAFFFADDKGSVFAVDRESGGSLWKQDALAYRDLGAPGIVDRYVVVGDFEGYLHMLDIDDGHLAGRMSTDGDPITAAPIQVGKGNFIVQTREGHLYAITLR